MQTRHVCTNQRESNRYTTACATSTYVLPCSEHAQQYDRGGATIIHLDLDTNPRLCSTRSCLFFFFFYAARLSATKQAAEDRDRLPLEDDSIAPLALGLQRCPNGPASRGRLVPNHGLPFSAFEFTILRETERASNPQTWGEGGRFHQKGDICSR